MLARLATASGHRLFEGQPADWPADAPSNEEHRAVTAWRRR
jgi:hypothetical protein